jgi:hypothetical protein
MPTAIGIVGTDGYTPIYNPDGRWEVWNINEIYMGGVGQNKFIPKVNDWVVDPAAGSVFIVTDLNNVTLVPELATVNLNQTTIIDEIIVSTNDNYRIYYDKSTTPYTLAVDSFARIYSNSATTARIYRGEFIDNTKIISRRYDNSGNFLGHDIPLSLVAYNSHDNYSVKWIPTCNTTAELNDGEPCLVVVFNATGKVLGKIRCIVDETTYVAPSYAEHKYITNIFLKSAFIDITNPETIEFPVNLPLASFNPIGVVQYNDGTQVEYPVDGTKFTLYGLDSFISTIIGHRVPLVLSYKMAPTESALATVTSDNYFVTKPYTLVVSNPNTSYNVKLFIYPEWLDTLNGYRLKAYLMNLDRNILFDVTSAIYPAVSSPAFNPVGYGNIQRLTFNINLQNVSPIFNYFIHSQTVDIILRGPATDDSNPNLWEVATQIPSTVGLYGTSLRAQLIGVTNNIINISNGYTTVEQFLNNTYYKSAPIINPITETTPIVPTHMEVKYINETIRVPIEQFNNNIVFTNNLTRLKNVEVVFLKQTPLGMLNLSIVSMTIR